MNERVVSSELTGRTASSKLDITHPMSRGRFAMDTGRIEEPPRDTERNADGGIITIPDNPTTLEGLIASRIPQEQREVARAAWDSWAQIRGRPLSQREITYRETGVMPMVGGADTPDADTRRDTEAPTPRRERSTGRRGLMQEGISLEGITHPDLADILRDLNARVDENRFVEAINKLNSLESSDPNNPIPPHEIANLQGRISEAVNTHAIRGERIGFYLQDDDRAQLMVNPQGWLDSKFDLLYLSATSGQELDSQVLQGIQSLVGEANQFLSRRFQIAFDEGNIAEREKYSNALNLFNRTWGTRRGLLITRFQVDRRGMEQIVGSFESLRAEGLIGALSFDDSRTGAMFNRMNELLEDVRLAQGGSEQHLTPEMVANLQKNIEEEQIQLAQAEVGVFASEYRRIRLLASRDGRTDAEDKLRSEIRRSVRTAYDVFISSQREAIISARGRHLKGIDAYFSDTGGAFNIFNLEDLLIAKYNLLNTEQNKLLNRVKLDLVEHESKAEDIANLTTEQKLEHGRRLFRDLFAVPDFFSSGWRIKGILQQIESVTRYKIQNTKIVESLIKGQGTPEERERYDSYMNTRMQQVDWEAVVASFDGNIEEAKRKTAQEYAQGKTNGEGILGLNVGERANFLRSLHLDNKAIDKQAKEVSRDLALFLRLKGDARSQEVLNEGGFEGDYKGTENRKVIWERIKKYRPEEIIRIVRDRSAIPLESTGHPSDYDQAMLTRLNSIFSQHGVSGYDEFKKDYAAVLKSLREEGFSEGVGKQIDFRSLTAEQAGKINKAMNAVKHTQNVNYAEKVTSIYRGMHSFIDGGDIINQLLKNSKYEDIYGRTITVDDAILGQLEYIPENSGITRLSQRWSTESGADGLKRNGNDLNAAVAAGKGLISFLKSESKDEWRKGATEFAKQAGEYNGLKDGVAKCFRYTYGTYLLTAEQDYLWDLVGIGNLPFRLDSSDIERIFGQGVDPLTREQVLEELDHVRGLLTGEPTADNPHLYYEQMMRLAGIETFQRIRDKSFQVSIFIMLILMLAPVAGAAKAMSAATK